MFINLLSYLVAKIFLLALLLITGSIFSLSYGQTVLTVGDIVVIGIKTNNNTDGGNDAIKLMTMVDLTCGTQFVVTDNNWRSGTNSWYCNDDEFAVQITVTKKICAGSVIYMDVASAGGSITSSSGAVTKAVLGNPWGTDYGLSSGGDNVFILGPDVPTGTQRSSPTFIFGIKHNGPFADIDCSTGANPKDNSGKPSSLTLGTTAVEMSSSEDQWHYNCSGVVSGTKATLLANIGNKAKWTKNSGQSWNNSTCTFTVTDPCTAPTHQATNFSASSITNTTATVKWSNCPSPGIDPGNTQVLVIVRAGSSVTTDPTGGTTYTANAAFGSGTAIGAGFVTFIGSGTQVNLTGLSPGVTYYVAVYEFSCTGLCYNTAELPGNFGTTALPINLIYFHPDKGENNIIDFEWATASEINNDYFEIEASSDGTNFLSIGKVKGSGNAPNYKNYNYSWVSEKELRYFRLKQVDYDGEFHYSTTQTITSDKPIELEVFPVPASEELFVKINGLEEVEISILDIVGKEIYSTEIIPENGIFPLDIKKFVAGTYILLIKSDNKIISKRFYKE